EPLIAAARDTDGQVIAGPDVDAGLARAAREARGSYLLTYHAAHRENGAFHRVEVHTKRAGGRLHARAGLWAPSQDDVLREAILKRASEPPAPVKYQLPRRISPLIQPWFGLSRADDGKTLVTFVWEPAPRVPGDRVRHTPTRIDVKALASDDS